MERWGFEWVLLLKYKLKTVLEHGILNKRIVGGSLSFIRATKFLIEVLKYLSTWIKLETSAEI